MAATASTVHTGSSSGCSETSCCSEWVYVPSSAASIASSAPTTVAAQESALGLEDLLECLSTMARYLESDKAKQPTPFHSRMAPPVSLVDYGLRVVHYSGYGAEGLTIGLALLGRYVKATGIAPTFLTAHRLLATCIVVGMKATSDKFVKNVYMAPIVGVPLVELNWLELTLLEAIGFCAIPTPHEFHRTPREIFALDDSADHRPCSLFVALTNGGLKPSCGAEFHVSPFGNASMSFSSSAASTPRH
jgi:hypothetical protein